MTACVDPSDRPVKYNHNIQYDSQGGYNDDGNYNNMVELSNCDGSSDKEDAGQRGSEMRGRMSADYSRDEVDTDDDNDERDCDTKCDSDGDECNDEVCFNALQNGYNDEVCLDILQYEGNDERHQHIQLEQERYLMEQETDLADQLNRQKKVGANYVSVLYF